MKVVNFECTIYSCSFFIICILSKIACLVFVFFFVSFYTSIKKSTQNYVTFVVHVHTFFQVLLHFDDFENEFSLSNC